MASAYKHGWVRRCFPYAGIGYAASATAASNAAAAAATHACSAAAAAATADASIATAAAVNYDAGVDTDSISCAAARRQRDVP